MNPHPIGTFARLAFARARRLPVAPRILCVRQGLPGMQASRLEPCQAGCAHVAGQVWTALECAYPDLPLEGPGNRQALAALFAPLMAQQGWRFCRCYLGGLAEHRFISRLVDTPAANAAAELLAAAGGAR
jgi:hypothetical protein